MHKQSLILTLLLAPLVYSQKVTMKKWILPADYAQLNNMARESMAFGVDVQIALNAQDLYSDGKIKPGKPATLVSIKELEKQIKSQPSDALIFAEMSDIYRRMKMQEEAEAFRQKAVYLFKEQLKQYPDSATIMVSLAKLYMFEGELGESIHVLKKAIITKPAENEPPLMLAMNYLMLGELDSIHAFVQEQEKIHPDLYSTYAPLSMYYFFDVLRKLNNMSGKEIQQLSTDSMVALDGLREFYERNPKDYNREYLYKTPRQVTLCFFLLCKAMARPGFDKHNPVFAVEGTDKQKLEEGKDFILESLKKKELKDKYLSWQMLGDTYILLEQYKEAIGCIKKSIALRPADKSSVEVNANDQYDNLIACHFILKDTAACEKILLEKIKLNPAVDTNTLDYQHLGNLYLSTGKFADSEKMYKKALNLYFGNTDAMKGLAMLSFMKGDSKTMNDYISRVYTIKKDDWVIYYLSALQAIKDNDAKNAYELYQIVLKMNDQKWVRAEMEEWFEVKE